MAVSPLTRALIVIGTAAAAGGAAVLLEPRPQPRKRRRKAKPKTQLSGMDVDEPAEEPPDDLVYDNRPPCHLPEEPAQENPDGGEDVGFCIPPRDLEPKKRTSAPFAEGGERPIWPIRTTDDRKLQVSYQDVRNMWHGRWGNHFGTARKGDDGRQKLHAGVDLFADEGDVVRAMEDGIVLATLPFHHGSSAIYVLHDSGVLVNYGEVEENSWREFGIESGVETLQRVEQGQPLARIGKMKKGSTMLHLETFEKDTPLQDIRDGKLQWERNKPAPENLLDPSRYLVRAQRVEYEEKQGLS